MEIRIYCVVCKKAWQLIRVEAVREREVIVININSHKFPFYFIKQNAMLNHTHKNARNASLTSLYIEINVFRTTQLSQ